MTIMNSFDGVKIYYSKRKGKGKNKQKETIVFLHGWLQNHSVWKKQREFFSKEGYDTVVLDLRGFGKSQHNLEEKQYRMSSYVKDVEELLKVLNLKNAYLVGHSFGGMISLSCKKLLGKQVKKLVLINSSYENPLRHQFFSKYLDVNPYVQKIINILLSKKNIFLWKKKDIDFSTLTKFSDVQIGIKSAQQTNLKSALLCLREIITFNEEKNLEKITIPCLIIHGEWDIVTPKTIAKKMHTGITNARIKMIKKGQHDTPIQRGEEICMYMDDFFKEK